MSPRSAIGFVFLATALVACATVSPPEPARPSVAEPTPLPSPPALDLASLADPQSIAFAALDVAALRQAPYAAAGLAALSRELAPSETSDVSELVLRIDRAILSVRSATARSYVGVALLRGRFQPSDATLLAATGSAARVPFLSDSFVARGERLDAAVVADHTLILGARALVDAALERQRDGGAGGPPSDPRFAALAGDLGLEAVDACIVVVPDTALLRSLEHEAFHLPAGSLDGVRAYGLAIDLGTSVGVHGVLHADTATRLVAQGLLEADLARAEDDAGVRARGLSEAAARAIPRIEGSLLRLDLELHADEVARLLGGGSAVGSVDP